MTRILTRVRVSTKPGTVHNALTDVTTPDGTHWRYAYDPLGRRTSKQRLSPDNSIAEETTFTWDGTLLCEQTTTGPTPHPVTLTWDHQGLTPLSQTERLLNEATQQEIDARFFAIATDLIGTPTELIDDTGTITWHTRTTLWGTTTWNRTATAYTPLRFPGQYYDPETGLHYNHHRYYDPTTARYTTPDPLGLAPAPNPTTYVHSPHTRTDSQGLAPDYPTRVKEKVLDTYDSFEQARNKALDLLGEIDPHTRVPLVGRLEAAESTYGRTVGFTTRVDGVYKQFRLDFDPEKGTHINVMVGKGASAQKWAVPWRGTEEDLIKMLKGNT
ncbi:hypothetical protein SRB5_58350 [Streptomyces sp. RB5]|uniref:Teneurin-like YD-shell domain-containing protein n=1 Tax=Streptomyces smaragdinus TaxID=2585196 RepID=A0A7K0CQ93_9ACTN|nr:hypothetical protein [Streptomyces smaragdinus]